MLAAIPSGQGPSKHLSFDGHSGSILVPDNVTVIKGDTVDSPDIRKLVGKTSASEENIFHKMKYECNRQYSFKGNWPVKEITPESLAAAGFFYLQQEDRVQCPFCQVIVFNWTHGDNPLSEHIKKSPKCPFLIGADVGNIPLIPRKSYPVMNIVKESQVPSRSTCALYKPQHPRMADVKRRLLTYANWPLSKPTAQQLAECGLYYSGVADVVKCFFCGGSLGNWEEYDDPWVEHTKFFPDCAFLSLAASRRNVATANPAAAIASLDIRLESMKHKSSLENGLHKPNPVNGHLIPNNVNKFPKFKPLGGPHFTNYTAGIIEEALEIFPKALVEEAVKRLGRNVHTLQELCDQILELKEVSSKSKSNKSQDEIPSNDIITDKSSAACSDALLCKICMDRQSDVLFQPCGHLVSCSKCAQLIADCPVCRRPIINVIKAFFC